MAGKFAVDFLLERTGFEPSVPSTESANVSRSPEDAEMLLRFQSAIRDRTLAAGRRRELHSSEHLPSAASEAAKGEFGYVDLLEAI